MRQETVTSLLKRLASMKVSPKRKGNVGSSRAASHDSPLNESPSEKEGKLGTRHQRHLKHDPLNESPSEKEGKYSVKAPPNLPARPQ